MARRIVLVALAAAAVLTAALGSLVIWRVPIAQSLLDWAAVEFDIPGGRATVKRLAADRARVTDLAAGDRAELTVDSIEIEYGTGSIAKGEVDAVTIEGLTLTLDLREGASPLGSLQPLLDRLGDRGSDDAEESRFPGRLPAVRFREGRVAAETPYGPAGLAFDGTLEGAHDGGLGGGREGDPRLRLEGALTSGVARLSMELSASGNPQQEAEAQLAITDGWIELPDDVLRLRALDGDLNVRVEAGRPISGHGTLAADGLAVAGTPFDDAQLNFHLTRERAVLAAGLGSDDGSFDLALEGRAESLDARPRVSLELTSEINEMAPIWAFSSPPFPTGGEGRLQLSAAGEFPALPNLPAGGSALLAWLADGELSGRVVGTAAQLALPGSEALAGTQIDLAAVWADSELSLATRTESRASVARLSATDLAALGLPAGLADDVIRLTGGALSLALPAPSQGPTTLVWRPHDPARGVGFDGSALITAGPLTAAIAGVAEATLGPTPALTRADFPDVSIAAVGIEMGGYTVEDLDATGSFRGDPRSFAAVGDLKGRLAVANLNGLSADRVSLALPLAVTRDADVFGLTLTEPGRLSVEGLAAADLLRSEQPIDVAIAESETTLTLAEDGGIFGLRHEARLGLGETLLLLQPETGAGFPLQISVPDVALAGALGEDGRYWGEAAVRDAALTLPQYNLALEALSADLTLPGDVARAAVDFEVAALRHLASPAAFAPLQLSGRAERSDETVDVTALVRRPDGEPLARVVAAHDLATGSGQADVTLQPLRFAPDGLQPGALSPLFAALTEARGSAEGSVALTWSGDGLAGGASFEVEDLSFSSGEMSVQGLDLRLELDSLLPPASPPHQVLRADVIDVGVPLKDLEVRFRLPPDSPGQILIENASFATVGSRFALRDALLDPAGDRLETLLQVDQLDIAVLFDVLAVEGLSGSGELTGTIPIRRDGTLVTIEDARLEAQEPGVLRFRSDAAQQALQGGGEHVDLVIQALQDFHYQTLTLTGNLDPGGEARLRLEILGHNPAVLEGHPFQFNINLSGNPTPILEAMLLSRTLFGNIMERARRLSQ